MSDTQPPISNSEARLLTRPSDNRHAKMDDKEPQFRGTQIAGCNTKATINVGIHAIHRITVITYTVLLR